MTRDVPNGATINLPFRNPWELRFYVLVGLLAVIGNPAVATFSTRNSSTTDAERIIRKLDSLSATMHAFAEANGRFDERLKATERETRAIRARLEGIGSP